MQGPKLNLKDVASAADKFLKAYHSPNKLPIPIEEIVEIKMGIALYAVPGIKPLLGIDADGTNDCQGRFFLRNAQRRREGICQVGSLKPITEPANATGIDVPLLLESCYRLCSETVEPESQRCSPQVLESISCR